MDNQFYNKTTLFLKNARECEDRGDYTKAIEITDNARAYIERTIKDTSDDVLKLYYLNYHNIWALYKRSLEMRNDFEIYKKENAIELKKLRDQIKQAGLKSE